VLPDRDYQTLESLPVEALRLEEELLPLLRQFDIRTIGQLRQLPRPAVHARFGLHLLQRLDQAFGDISEPLTWEIAQAPTQASWSFEWPCSDRRSVETALEHLLTQMLAKLVPQQLGIQRLQCTLQVLDGRPHGFTVGLLHANNSLSYLMGMLRLHLDRVQPPAEITGTLLEAKRVVPLEFQQGQMFAHDTRAERWRRVPALIEILSNRLGKQAVLRPRLLPEAQPELAWRYEPWLEQDLSLAMPAGQKEKQALLRPLVLQASAVPIAAMSAVAGGPPLRFSWQRRSFTVARHWGPERIETGWWRGRHVRRDYYLVETTAGERFWLFRAVEDGTWYLHGVFA
jgi:protein ImuB